MAEWVTAIATLFTALVIAASATAALIQIRHMRKSNEIAVITKWAEVVESEEFAQARAFVLSELPRILGDPARVSALSWNPFPLELQPVRAVANLFESVGAFVKLGSVEARVACELWSLVVVECWRGVAPVVALLRHRYQRDALWENFEYLAVLAEDFMATHPDDTYPRGVRRMPTDKSLLNTLKLD